MLNFCNLTNGSFDDIKNDLAGGSSLVVVAQLRDVVREIDEWIEHIERAKTRAAAISHS